MGLGKPQGQESTPPTAARFIVEGKFFPLKYVLTTPQLPHTWAVAMAWAAPHRSPPPG